MLLARIKLYLQICNPTVTKTVPFLYNFSAYYIISMIHFFFFVKFCSTLKLILDPPLASYNLQQSINDFISLLSNHNEITMPQRNLQVLIIEIYKIINHIVPPIISSLFEIHKNTHNTRYFQVLSNESRRRVNYGLG